MRYQRPVTSIAVSLQHSARMLFGGTFEPAYTMTVSALPAQAQPATNRVNATLIQAYMEEALGVLPARGLLRFVALGEGFVARGGKTVAGEIEEAERLERERERKRGNSIGGWEEGKMALSSRRERGNSVGGGEEGRMGLASRRERAMRRLSVKVHLTQSPREPVQPTTDWVS